MEASLTCAVCLGVFRDPVTLPHCSHNFCKCCVLECATPHAWTVVQPRNGQYSTITCPLCRKVSTLPGGLASLPVNTTLAEVVRLVGQSGRGRESAGAEVDGAGKSCCAEHPEYKLELYCKNCEQACCGKCVSLRHQGIFHNVNLLDMVFQEEKLVFFNSLKTLREIHERLTKEISEEEKKAETNLKAVEDSVTSVFEEVQKALDLKKQQLLDLVKQQQSASIKRSEVRKVTKAHHKTTVEGLLKTCETILDDYEPRSFLQVACGLNKRMKSNLELIEFCADSNEDVLKLEPQRVDVQSVLDAISALKITSISNDVSKQNGSYSFKSISRTWERGMTTNEKYCPVQDQELIYLQGQMQKMSIRFVCITKMPEYQHLSYEELRLKYYEPSVVEERDAVSSLERQRPFVFNNVKNFNFKMSLVNSVKPTRGKRQETCDEERSAYGKKDVFKAKPIKMHLGKMAQKNNLFAHARDIPSSSLGGLSTRLPYDNEVEKPPKLCSNINNKALLPNFYLGKSTITNLKKCGRNEKSCKKLKSTACMPKFGSVLSISAMANQSAVIIANGLGNTEEDMSVSSASSEEYYDASCTIETDVDVPCEESTSHSNTDDGEPSTFQRIQL